MKCYVATALLRLIFAIITINIFVEGNSLLTCRLYVADEIRTCFGKNGITTKGLSLTPPFKLWLKWLVESVVIFRLFPEDIELLDCEEFDITVPAVQFLSYHV